MEENLKKQHSLYLENRNGLKLTGVTDVEFFDEETVSAFTDYGLITVSGSSLQVEELNLETGLLEVSGEVTALVYSSKTKKEKNILKRFFSA